MRPKTLSLPTRRKVLATGAAATLLTLASKITSLAQDHPKEAKTPSKPVPNGAGGKKAGVRVVPYPAPEPLGAGKDRALVLGGGGEWFEAWQLAYVSTLAKNGVDLSTAEAVVGTSAGSVLGTLLTSGRLAQGAKIFEWFAENPAFMAKLIVVNTGAESQPRARKLQQTTKSFSPEAIQEMGRAAMAAKNAPIADLQTAIQQIIGPMDWPSPTMHTTANDCYTGERIVVYPDSGIPINEAISASMSLPGCFGPTWLDDHYCMDGGISRSGTHTDLMAGAKRVLVISLSDGNPKYAQLSPFHAPIEDELNVAREKGSKVFATYANPPAGTNFLDPKEMPLAAEMGKDRAEADLATLKTFWNA